MYAAEIPSAGIAMYWQSTRTHITGNHFVICAAPVIGKWKAIMISARFAIAEARSAAPHSSIRIAKAAIRFAIIIQGVSTTRRGDLAQNMRIFLLNSGGGKT